MVREMTLLEAFEYQMKNTSAKSREAVPLSVIEEKGGIEYLQKCTMRGYRLRDVSMEVGCAISTVAKYCQKRGTQWSEL